MVDYDFYEEFNDPETYDLECDNFDADIPVIEQWVALSGGPLLDLACGTGRMAIHLAARGYTVTGVDIVPAMIERARHKADARSVSVEWIVSDARAFHLGKQFPFVFMLMNAFQFLHTRKDHEAMLACVREHLTPDGYFLFETRNPTPRNLNELRHPEGEQYTLPDGGRLSIAEQQQYDPITQIQHYVRELQFVYADGKQETKRLRTALRYIFPQEMEALLHYNGFKIHTCYGDWGQAPLRATSPAMIYVCQKRH
ncbi:MAG: class I SAM-dependent methyltransferase [Chloroflexota bacterium]